MQQLVRSLSVWAALVACAVAQKGGAQGEQTHPAPGTSIIHFAQIEEGVYKGLKPKNHADYRFLQSKHIRYILDLKFFPFTYRLEKSKAKKYGITVIPATINASKIR